MKRLSWLSTFSVKNGVVHYHETGAQLRVDLALLCDVATWMTYYAPIRLRAAACRLLRPGPTLWFMPRPPPPWYLIWNAFAWIGARAAVSPAAADACVYFEDATWVEGVEDAAAPCINGACRDVSKSHVARVFARTFGYSLAIDPETTLGPAVEKSELNGAHDGVVVNCPTPRAPGRVYQRLVETGEDGFVEDLRTPCVGGEPIVVFIKRRPRAKRFSNFNTEVALAEPRDVFSTAELERIRAFVRDIRLDWGGLDILRERETGRLYIVDVNKTDMPPIRLPFADKMRASRKLGEALRDLVAKIKRARTQPVREHASMSAIDEAAS